MKTQKQVGKLVAGAGLEPTFTGSQPVRFVRYLIYAILAAGVGIEATNDTG